MKSHSGMCNLILVSSLLILGSFSGLATGSKILFFIGLSSHSHRVALQPLAAKLASRGHEVTFFSPIKPETPNPKITEFCTKALQELNDNFQDESSTAAALKRLEDRFYDPFFEGNYIWDMMYQIQGVTLRDPEFQQWVHNSKFDLIIVDHPGKEFIYPIAHRMKAKVILFVPIVTPLIMDFDPMGLPLEPWIDDYIPNKYWFIPQRVYNVLSPLHWYYSQWDYYYPKIEALYKEIFHFDYPPMQEMIRSFDLIFINEHYSMGDRRAFPPYVVPVGGMHVKDSNGTLPKELEDFISDVDQFVFISFGSIIQVSKLPVRMHQILFEAVASFPKTKFFWKWEGEIPKNMPKNAYGKNWFPQQDVLAHPKCKGFVTQGGLMSMQQAIHHQVPLIVVPGFGDQPYNAKLASRSGFGIYMELIDINVESFSGAIRELLENPTYAKTMKEVSRRFKDRPLSAVDTAVWWSEYVLRQDTSTLKSDNMKLSWWQRRMMDFWFLVFSALTIGVATIAFILVQIVKFVRGKFQTKKQKKA